MTTLEIQNQAKKLHEMGSALSIEKLIAFLEKKEAKKDKRNNRIAKGFVRREEAARNMLEIDARLATMTNQEQSNYYEEIRLRSISNQLPSSMR